MAELSDNKKLKVGLLLDTLEPSNKNFEIIQHLQKNKIFSEPIIFYGYTSSRKKLIFDSQHIFKSILLLSKKILQRIISRAIFEIEQVFVKNQYPDFGQQFLIKALPEAEKVELSGIWSKSQNFLEFSDNDILKITNKNIDILLRCGTGILHGKILKAARFGILSMHHGDNRVNRGLPSGFWEVYEGHDSSGFIVQFLNTHLDAGKVVLRGNIPTAKIWLLNQVNLQHKSLIFLLKILDKIAVDKAIPPSEKFILNDSALNLFPKNRVLLMYILKILIPVILRSLKNKMFGPYQNNWSIGYAKHENFGKPIQNYKEISNPSGRFLADPFIHITEDKKVIFAEDYDYRKQRGRISAIDVTNNEPIFLGPIIEEKFHLSFPFIFEDEKKLLMIPESRAASQIRLYECINFPMKWKLNSILIKDIEAVDSMMIKIDGIYFLLTNICSANTNDLSSELHIFFSENLFSNEWQPFIENPILFDSMRARNAGLVHFNNLIYRVNQVQTKNQYGKRFQLNLIDMLQKNNYKESIVSTISPTFKKDIIATHHFHVHKEYAVIDFCRKKSLKKILRS